MIFIPSEVKNDPVKRWNLPDKVFFAAGACHILAYAFLQKFPDNQFKPYWIKPGRGFRGNHIFVSDGETAFDYRGLTPENELLKNLTQEMVERFPGWNYELVEITEEALISERLSRTYKGLWLREPNQYLHNALPRAEAYLADMQIDLDKSTED